MLFSFEGVALSFATAVDLAHLAESRALAIATNKEDIDGDHLYALVREKGMESRRPGLVLSASARFFLVLCCVAFGLLCFGRSVSVGE